MRIVRMTGLAIMTLFALLIVGIIYHFVNATRPNGMPTEIIESDDVGPSPNHAAQRLQALETLRSQQLITDAEYAAKREEILHDL